MRSGRDDDLQVSLKLNSVQGATAIKALNHLDKFQGFYGRLPGDGRAQEETLEEIMKRQTDRVECELLIPKLKHWNKWGRVTRMLITPPETVTKLNHYYNWKVYIFYDYHKDKPLIIDAEEALQLDRYLVCWYVLWRKWTMRFKIWEFAALNNEVPVPVTPPEESLAWRSYFNKSIKENPNRKKVLTHIKEWRTFVSDDDGFRSQYLRQAHPHEFKSWREHQFHNSKLRGKYLCKLWNEEGGHESDKEEEDRKEKKYIKHYVTNDTYSYDNLGYLHRSEKICKPPTHKGGEEKQNKIVTESELEFYMPLSELGDEYIDIQDEEDGGDSIPEAQRVLFPIGYKD